MISSKYTICGSHSMFYLYKLKVSYKNVHLTLEIVIAEINVALGTFQRFATSNWKLLIIRNKVVNIIYKSIYVSDRLIRKIHPHILQDKPQSCHDRFLNGSSNIYWHNTRYSLVQSFLQDTLKIERRHFN